MLWKAPPPVEEAGPPIVEWLQRLLGERLVAVALFGSRARGDHREESDWDVLVIARDLPDGFLDRHRFFRVSDQPHLGTSVQVTPKTPGEFDGSLPAFYLDIALDAKVSYDPTGYLGVRLDKLRRIIDKAGLYRERTSRTGLTWLWRDPPPFGQWSIEWDYLDDAG
jgi:hypothetical protein